MSVFVLRRVLTLLATLVGASVIIFLVLDALPGNAAQMLMGADASAAAGPVGREADAGTDWKMKAEVLTYSRARGVFAGIDLSGTVVTQDKDETRVLYGKFIPFSDILSGKVEPPRGTEAFLSTVSKYTSQA